MKRSKIASIEPGSDDEDIFHEDDDEALWGESKVGNIQVK
jgi:hypothetical protein